MPKISLAVPLSSRAIERGLKVRAMLMISSKVMLPLCLTEFALELEEMKQKIQVRYSGTHCMAHIAYIYWIAELQYVLFLTFLRSRGGSFNALMMSDAADGTTEMVA